MIGAFSWHVGDGRWLRVEPVVSTDTVAFCWSRNEELNRAVTVPLNAAGCRAYAQHLNTIADVMEPRQPWTDGQYRRAIDLCRRVERAAGDIYDDTARIRAGQALRELHQLLDHIPSTDQAGAPTP